MVSKNFHFRIVLRVVLLAAVITLLAWCIVEGYYLRSIYIAVAVTAIILELIWFLERVNRDIKAFLQSLMQRDFTLYFPSEGKGKGSREVYDAANGVMDLFRQISSEKEIQHRYLELLVDHVTIGILSFDANEKVHLVNNALKKLLHKNVLFHLTALESVDAGLLETLREIRAGETRLLRMRIGGDLLQLSVHASEFRLESEPYKLISMQDIRNELDAREMEAWQKLIRVLTHEIMNSVSPISSLSGTLYTLVQKHDALLRKTSPELYNALNSGLDAIKTRSEGLHGFTVAYRRLTQIPQPSFREVDVPELLQRIHTLFDTTCADKNVKLSTHAMPDQIIADPDLIEQVLINLVANAIDAVEHVQNPAIDLSSFRMHDGRVCIQVIDNGPGINSATIDKIFIPFFTTKRHGSGIGLAVARQIIQLHKGDIKVDSVESRGTTFSLIF